MSTERGEWRRIPQAWEPYLTGQVETEPQGASWVREQLTFYGILQPEASHPGRRRRHRQKPAPSPLHTSVSAAPPPLLQIPHTLDMAKLRQWLELYVSHLFGLNRAPGTLDGYRTDVEQFFAFCERRGLNPLALKRMDLLSHLAILAQQGYQASTRARKTHAIKGFFRFLVDAEVLPRNPFATIPSPQVERRERRVLSEREYQALREQARQHSPRAAAWVTPLGAHVSF